METRVKLRNPNKGKDTGIKLSNGVERNIKGGSFIFLPIEEFEFVFTTCKSVQKKMLVIENYEMLDKEWLEMIGIESEADAKFVSDKLIKEALSSTTDEFEKFIGKEINSRFEKDRLFEIAKESEDITKGKMKIIEMITGYSFEVEDGLN